MNQDQARRWAETVELPRAKAYLYAAGPYADSDLESYAREAIAAALVKLTQQEPILCDTMLGNRPCTLKYYQPSFVQARDQQWAERVAELERDRDEWEDATISGNTRFKMAEEKLASEREKTAELERVLDIARFELSEVLEWAKIEKAPLRDQEMRSLEDKIATIDAAMKGKP